MIIKHTIGPSFIVELRAAGVPLSGIGWTSDQVITGDAFNDEDLKALEAVIAAHDPTKQPAPLPIVIPKIDLWRRMTDAEHDAMADGVATQPRRIQDIFNATENFRSDAPEWALLQAMAVQLYGADRAAELLSA